MRSLAMPTYASRLADIPKLSRPTYLKSPGRLEQLSPVCYLAAQEQPRLREPVLREFLHARTGKGRIDGTADAEKRTGERPLHF